VQTVSYIIENGRWKYLQLLPRLEYLKKFRLLVLVLRVARTLEDDAHEEFDVLAEEVDVLSLNTL